MRIIAGKHKGRPLAAPKGKATRPTSDRAREALFNVLAHADWAPRLEGARIIDLFAGSGSLGLEALSRGAEFALFIETDKAARTAIRKNIDTLGLSDIAHMHKRSATALGARPAIFSSAFDIAFLDPPYHKDLVLSALDSLTSGNWLTNDAIIIAETAADECLDWQGWTPLQERAKGAAKLTFLRQY